MTMIRWHQDQLNIPYQRIMLSSTLGLAPSPNSNVISDAARALGAAEYAAGPAEYEFIMLEDTRMIYEQNGLRILNLRTEYRPYPQTSAPFAPGLAAMDLILNLGPGQKARAIMEGATEAVDS
jgi:hypothetical protein